MSKHARLLLVFLSLCLAATGCVPDEVKMDNELGPDTLSRIDTINGLLERGVELGPETRDLIRELNETIEGGIEAGFDEATLQRVDHLLRILEDDLKIGLDEETLKTLDELISAIDEAPGSWESVATEIISELERSAGTVAGQMASEVKSVLEEARFNSQKVIATAGGEFRCNVDFLGAKANETIQQFIGRSLIGRLKAIISGKEFQPAIPVPWVCQILPEKAELIRMGDQFVFKEGVIAITGYNFVDDNHPTAHVVDEQDQAVDSIQLFPSRQSDYLIQLNLQEIDFRAVPVRSRIEFRWPNVPETSAIAVLLPPPPKPTADFRGTPRTGTAPLEVAFTDLSTGSPTNWKWEFGDGESSANRNPTYRYQNPGSYTVKLTSTNAQGSSIEVKSQYITVRSPPPKPTADFKAVPLSGAAPLEVVFTDLSIDNPTGWKWDFGDGASSELRNPIHIYSQPGRYTVILTATNAHGSDEEEKNAYITVDPPPLIAGFRADLVSGEVPLSVQFIDTSTGNPTSWKWEFGDGKTSTVQNPWHLYLMPGQYDVKLTVANPQGWDEEVKSSYIVADPRPIWSPRSVYFFKFTNLGDNVIGWDTGALADDWVCGIVGMAARMGDINEDDAGDILRTYMYVENGKWRIRADFRSHKDHENWDIYTMCLDRRRWGPGFAFETLKGLGDNVTKPTSYSTSDYTCGIVGMAAYDGDIQENGAGDILLAYMEPKGDKWQIRADFRTHNKKNENWTVNVLCLKNEPESLYARPPWIYRHYPNLEDNVRFNTGIGLDYLCGIVGMAARAGDINEDDAGPILRTFMYEQGGEWWIRADFRSHKDHENWDINVLCASTAIARKYGH